MISEYIPTTDLERKEFSLVEKLFQITLTVFPKCGGDCNVFAIPDAWNSEKAHKTHSPVIELRWLTNEDARFPNRMTKAIKIRLHMDFFSSSYALYEWDKLSMEYTKFVRQKRKEFDAKSKNYPDHSKTVEEWVFPENC